MNEQEKTAAGQDIDGVIKGIELMRDVINARWGLANSQFMLATALNKADDAQRLSGEMNALSDLGVYTYNLVRKVISDDIAARAMAESKL